MHQAISLLSGLNSVHSSVSLDSIPLEILAIILSNVHPEVNKSVGRLMMVSKSLTRIIIPALEYVRRSRISDGKLAKYLSGLFELFVIDKSEGKSLDNNNIADLSSFSENVWRNLVTLWIPYRLVSQLSMTELSDKFIDNPDNCQEVSYFYRMKNLRELSIFESGYITLDCNINPSVIPNIHTINLVTCFISNLSEFNNLQHLELSRCVFRSEEYIKIISSLNLKSLVIVESSWSKLNISMSSLRSLKIGGCWRNLDISGCSNLESLSCLILVKCYSEGWLIFMSLS